jgi:AcrR family transcriptional regulator
MGRPPADSIQVATPERLLDAAEIEFSKKGYAAARLEDIARHAGIRRPSLLYHFPSKEKLYSATVERSFRHLGAALMQSMSDRQPFEERVDALVRTFSGFLETRPHMAPLIVRELIAVQGPGRSILLEQVVPLVGMVESYIREEGGASLRTGVPIRQAIMQSTASILLASAVGDLRGPLWGEQDQSVELTRMLLVADERPPPVAGQAD